MRRACKHSFRLRRIHRAFVYFLRIGRHAFSRIIFIHAFYEKLRILLRCNTTARKNFVGIAFGKLQKCVNKMLTADKGSTRNSRSRFRLRERPDLRRPF